MSKLPFTPRIFFKTLAVVVVIVIVAWVISLRLFYKEDEGMTPADWFGTVVSTLLFAYLIHLWLLPADGHQTDEEPPEEQED